MRGAMRTSACADIYDFNFPLFSLYFRGSVGVEGVTTRIQQKSHVWEFIDENGGGPGIRLRNQKRCVGSDAAPVINRPLMSSGSEITASA
jgi:hypothetical protein